MINSNIYALHHTTGRQPENSRRQLKFLRFVILIVALPFINPRVNKCQDAYSAILIGPGGSFSWTEKRNGVKKECKRVRTVSATAPNVSAVMFGRTINLHTAPRKTFHPTKNPPETSVGNMQAPREGGRERQNVLRCRNDATLTH